MYNNLQEFWEWKEFDEKSLRYSKDWKWFVVSEKVMLSIDKRSSIGKYKDANNGSSHHLSGWSPLSYDQLYESNDSFVKVQENLSELITTRGSTVRLQHVCFYTWKRSNWRRLHFQTQEGANTFYSEAWLYTWIISNQINRLWKMM